MSDDTTPPGMDIFSSIESATQDIDIYASLTKVPDYLKGAPGTILRFDVTPNITASDISNGSITRYFACQINHTNSEVMEITQSQYNTLRNIPLYSVVSVPWRITGALDDILPMALDNAPKRLYTGVITANTLAAKVANESIPGVGLKLSNPVQFYQGKG